MPAERVCQEQEGSLSQDGTVFVDTSAKSARRCRLDISEFHGDATVAALIDPSTQDCDAGLLHEMFIDRDVQLIRQIIPVATTFEDQWFWKGDIRVPSSSRRRRRSNGVAVAARRNAAVAVRSRVAVAARRKQSSLSAAAKTSPRGPPQTVAVGSRQDVAGTPPQPSRRSHEDVAGNSSSPPHCRRKSGVRTCLEDREKSTAFFSGIDFFSGGLLTNEETVSFAGFSDGQY
nr:DNA polymerase epsilon subunit B [Ipomoea batatas]